VRFGTGQHEAYIENDDKEETTFKNIEGTTFDVFHVPLRYKSELTKRGLNYEPRRAPVRKGPAKGWQGPFHRDVVLANRTDEVWAANSAGRDGFLDVYGKPIRLIPDRRLQKLLLLSFLYLSARSVERMLKTVARKTRRSCRRHVQRTLRSAGLMKPKPRTRVR
jgi:hypothetical protein